MNRLVSLPNHGVWAIAISSVSVREYCVSWPRNGVRGDKARDFALERIAFCHSGGSATTDRVHALQEITGSYRVLRTLQDDGQRVPCKLAPEWFGRLTNLSPGGQTRGGQCEKRKKNPPDKPTDFQASKKNVYIKLIRTNNVEPLNAAINFTTNSLKGVLFDVSSEIWLSSQ